MSISYPGIQPKYSSLFKSEPAVNNNPKIQYPLRNFIWRCFVIAGIIYTVRAPRLVSGPSHGPRFQSEVKVNVRGALLKL